MPPLFFIRIFKTHTIFMNTFTSFRELLADGGGPTMIRCGMPPFLECSSRGDKRFSAFYARLEAYDNQTIESIYQAAKVFEGGVTGLSIKQAKGKACINHKEVAALS